MRPRFQAIWEPWIIRRPTRADGTTRRRPIGPASSLGSLGGGMRHTWRPSTATILRHAITSEYYCLSMNGLDLPLTIDGQDVSNVGYFGLPEKDIETLPLALCWNDLRARGKGLGLGEYGVKTHPAWTVANGATNYHIARSEEEAKRLFLAVAHYALGLVHQESRTGASPDDPTWVFPWGMFYPNQAVPKDIAWTHRNEFILWRFFHPVYRPADLTVCLADQLRLGNDEGLAVAVAHRTFADLLALHYQFNVIDDEHLDRLPPATKMVLFPCPMALSDEVYAKLRAWVSGGGTLLVTGDFSRDLRIGNGPAPRRLEELAGVTFLAENDPNVVRRQAREVQAEFRTPRLGRCALKPCLKVKPAGCDHVLAASEKDEAIFVHKYVGKGEVYFLADPIELAGDDSNPRPRRDLYAAILGQCSCRLGVRPQTVTPDEPWLHVMAQPTANGVVHVLFNTKRTAGATEVRIPTAAGETSLAIRGGWPGLAAATEDGDSWRPAPTVWPRSVPSLSWQVLA